MTRTVVERLRNLVAAADLITAQQELRELRAPQETRDAARAALTEVRQERAALERHRVAAFGSVRDLEADLAARRATR